MPEDEHGTYERYKQGCRCYPCSMAEIDRFYYGAYGAIAGAVIGVVVAMILIMFLGA